MVFYAKIPQVAFQTRKTTDNMLADGNLIRVSSLVLIATTKAVKVISPDSIDIFCLIRSTKSLLPVLLWKI